MLLEGRCFLAGLSTTIVFALLYAGLFVEISFAEVAPLNDQDYHVIPLQYYDGGYGYGGGTGYGCYDSVIGEYIC